MKRNKAVFFVTGAMGFVGSHWCEYLLRKGHKVIGLDLGKWHSRLMNYDNFNFVQDTIKNIKIVKNCIEQCDCVCHFCGIATPQTYVESPLKVIDITASTSIEIIDLCRLKEKLFFFTSTSEIYGKSQDIPFKEDGERVLGSTTTHRWCYSSSKALIEHYLQACADSKDLNYITVRLFNVYGPRLKGRVVSNFLENAFADQPLIVHGDGTQTRSFTYIDDVLRAFEDLIADPKCYNKVFNVGNPMETSIKDFAQHVLKITGSNAPIIHQNHQEYYGDSYEDVPRRVPDISRLKSHTGWEPEISLEEGLRRTVAYMRENS
jgi:UDP-glucose 4-epimerase